MSTSKTTNILYWIFTILFAAFFLADGIGGILTTEETAKPMAPLGYPLYITTIVGVGKIIGVIAILQTKWITLKEWAYAGFTINFLGAAASWYFVGGPAFYIIFPLIMLAFMFFTYYLWKKRIAVRT